MDDTNADEEIKQLCDNQVVRGGVAALEDDSGSLTSSAQQALQQPVVCHNGKCLRCWC